MKGNDLHPCRSPWSKVYYRHAVLNFFVSGDPISVFRKVQQKC